MTQNAFQLVRPRAKARPSAQPRRTVTPAPSQNITIGNSPVDVSAPIGIMVPPTPTWNTGEPPHVGWWLTRCGWSRAEWRWWNGRLWSWAVGSQCKPQTAAKYAGWASHDVAIVWRWDWPAGARVQRINQATGEVTGK